jgi:hypothetical protein
MFSKTLRLFGKKKKKENNEIVKTMVDDFFIIQKTRDILTSIKNKNLKGSTKILDEIKARKLTIPRYIYDKIFELSSYLRLIKIGKNLFKKEKLEFSLKKKKSKN